MLFLFLLKIKNKIKLLLILSFKNGAHGKHLKLNLGGKLLHLLIPVVLVAVSFPLNAIRSVLIRVITVLFIDLFTAPNLPLLPSN